MAKSWLDYKNSMNIDGKKEILKTVNTSYLSRPTKALIPNDNTKINPEGYTAKKVDPLSTTKAKTWLDIKKDMGYVEPKVKAPEKAQPFKNIKNNYEYGKLSENENLAWAQYRKTQTPADMLKAQQASAASQKYTENNQVGYGNALTKDFAQYVPQMVNQFKYSADDAINGAATGGLTWGGTAAILGQVGPQAAIPEEIVTVPAAFTAGAIKGGSLGYMKGMSEYGYDTMAGAAYKSLLDLGVSNDVALKASGDSALVNSLIELAGAGVDVVSLGTGKIVKELLSKPLKEASQKFAQSKALSALKAYGINLVSETAEEALQEKVSIESEKKAMSQSGLTRTATNKDDWNRIIESGKGGFNVALVSGGINATGNYAINVLDQRYSKQLNKEYESIVNALPEDSPTLQKLNAIKDNNANIDDDIKNNIIMLGKQELTGLPIRTSNQNITSDNIQDTVQPMANENNIIEQQVNRQQTLSKTQNTPSDNTRVENINNPKEVKTKMYNYLKDRVISTSEISKPITNNESGMKIEVSRATINQTLGKDDAYIKSQDKEIKIKSLAQIDNLIQNGQINIVDNSSTPSSKVTYATLTAPINVNGDNKNITMDIRRTDNGNKIFVHSMKSGIKESGIIDNEQSATINKMAYSALDKLGQTTGIKIEIVPNIASPDGSNENFANGQYFNGVLQISKLTDNPIMVVAKHEITHALKEKSPKAYQEYEDYVINAMKSNGSYDTVYSNMKSLYKRNGLELDETLVREEIAADATEKYLTDEKSINELVQDNPTLGKKILSLIRDFIKMVDESVKGFTESWMNTDQLKEAEKLWIKALNSVAEKKVVDSNVGNIKKEAAISKYSEQEFFNDTNIKYSIRKDAPPKKTIKAYKLLRIDKRYPGKLYPLFVSANEETPIGVWLDAEEGEMRLNEKTGTMKVKSKLGDLAYRPGWHLGDMPLATHIGVKGDSGEIEFMNPNHVWVECEVSADKNYQKEALSNGVNPKNGKLNRAKADLKKLPVDGFYRYKTNPNMTGEWIIAGSIKINRILSDDEAFKIVRDSGFEPLPRAKYSLKDSEGNELTKEQQEYFKDSKVRDKDGNLLVVYHGTNKNFNTFDTKYGKENNGAFWLSMNKDYAEEMAEVKKGNRIISAYINIKNPLIVTLKENEFSDPTKERKYIVKAKSKGHDGVIFKNDTDNELLQDEFYAVFNSNQIKDIENNKPTEKEDIRYQLKNDSDKEVERLKAANERLKEQFKLTQGVKLDKKSVSKISRTILKDYSSKYSKAEFESRLNKLYDRIANNDIEYDEMVEETQSIARNVLENASELSDGLYKEYAELRNTLRNTPISVNQKYHSDFDTVGGFLAFRRKNFGRLNITNDGVDIDILYQELADRYPEYFIKDIANPADQLLTISDILDSLVKVYDNPFNRDMNTAVEYLGLEIFEDFTSIPEAKPTFADKKKAEIDKAKESAKEKVQIVKYENRDTIKETIAKEKEKREKLRESMLAKKDMAAYKAWWSDKLKEKDMKSYYRRMVTELRQEKNTKIERTETRYKERISGIYEDRKMRDTKNSIVRKVNRLDKMLRKPDKKQYIPKVYTKSIAELLAMVDFTTDRQKENKILKLRDLKAEYEKIAKNTDEDGIQTDTDSYIAESLEMLHDKRVVDLNLNELEMLNNVVSYFEHSVRTFNKAFRGGKWVVISEQSESIIEDMRTNEPYTDSARFMVKHFKDMLNWGMLTPQMFFERMGTTFDSYYQEFRNALDVKIKDTKLAQDYMKDLLKNSDKKTVLEWTGDKVKLTTFTLSDGNVKLSPAQIMSLYMLNKREQARGHIYGLGIKPSQVIIKDSKGKRIEQAFNPVKVNPEEVLEIIKTLSSEQIKIAEGIGKFMNTISKNWINETTLNNSGYELAKEDNYFPIKTDSNFLKSDFDAVKLDPTFESMGFLKSTVKGAGNAIIVQDIFDIFTEHADKTSTYHAFSTPVENIKKVINYKTQTDSVKQSMNKKYGSQAFGYLKKFMVDLQGGARVESGMPIANMLIRNTKRSLIGLNLRSAIQQPTSIVRASALIDLKYLAKGATQKGDFDELLKYSPIAQWKAWGYFNLDTGRTMKDIILDNVPFLDKQYIPLQLADNATWAKMWNACKLEIEDTRKDLKVGSEEYFKAASDRFTEIVDKTQVVDTVLHRSDITRQNDTYWKVFTSFMSEPLKSYNLLLNAVEKYNNNKTAENKASMTRTISAYVATMAVNTMIISAVDMWRKDDDDKETYLIKWIGNVFNEITGMIPFVRDISSIVQGYSIKRMEYNGIEKLWRSMDRTRKYVLEMVKSEKHNYPMRLIVKDWIESVSYIYGVSTGNVTREIEALMKNYIKATDDEGAVKDVYEFMFKK